MADTVLSSTFAPKSVAVSPRCTWLWLTWIVPVKPVASFSLKSDKPWQPSDRQNRITVGWLTSALRAISMIGWLMIDRGWFSARSATRRSAGVKAPRFWGIRSTTADAPPFARFDSCSDRIADTPRNAGYSAVMMNVGTLDKYC